MKYARTLTSLAAALVVVPTIGAAVAVAHATLLRADPVPEAVLERQPSAVRLWFNEAIDPAPEALVVLDPLGQRVDEGANARTEDATLLEANVHGTEPGTYTVQWRIVSEDGHPASGAYTYSVERATAASVAGMPGSSHTTLLATSRGIHLVGLTLVLGALTLLLLIGAPTVAARVALARLGLVGGAVLLLGAPVMLFAQAVATLGSTSGVLAPGAVSAVVGGHWGTLWTLRVLGSLGLVVAFALVLRGSASGRAPLSGVLLAALVVVAGTGANGHAWTTPPAWLSVTVDGLHLTATGAWLGGICGMLVLLRASRSEKGGIQGTSVVNLRSLVPRFSALAILCVQILIVTGLYQTWAHVSGPEALATTSYGRTLLVKLGLVALVAVPAGFNRLVLKPRLSARPELGGDDTALVGRFTRLLGMEIGVGTFVLAAAALLSTLPPAKEAATVQAAGEYSEATERPTEAPSVPAPARVWTASTGEGVVVLSLDPAMIGSNRARLSFRDAAGREVDGGALRLRVVAPEGSAVATSVIQLEREGLGYQCLLALDAAGEWTLEVQLSETGVVRFGVEIGAPP